MYLFNFSSNFVNSNKTISTLILRGYVGKKFKIDEPFIDAVLNSQTLLYLIRSNVVFEDDLVLKLTESKLKGINIDGIELKKSTKNLTYKRIPKIEYKPDSNDLLYYKKILRLTS